MTKSTTTKPGLLTDVVDQLRMELIGAAEKRAANWKPLFDIKEVVVELQVKAVQDTTADAGIKLYVVSVGAKAKATQEITHKVVLKLAPTALPADEKARKSPLALGVSKPAAPKERAR